MKKLSSRLLLAFGVTAATMIPQTPSVAASTDWAADSGGRMRLLVTPPDAEGNIQAALQIEPEPGFITYWREPGESGIPPQVTVSGDDGVHLVGIEYPTPKKMRIADTIDMGYDGPVTLPLTFKAKPGTLPALDVSAFIGLCKDICIPFQASFEIPGTASAYEADTVERAILAVTRTTLPEKPSATFRVEQAIRTDDGLDLTMQLPEPQGALKTPPEIIIANSQGFVVSAPAGQWESGRYSFAIPKSDFPIHADLDAGDWLLLAKSDGRAMETKVVFDRR